ncbi:MAG: antibiotic biosynthesis monooxygenase [Bauldia sp.]
MPFVSVTRLRIRSLRFLPAFFWHSETSARQARRAPGFLAGALLPDRNRAFWTLSIWEDEAAMRAYRASGAHLKAMPRLMDWADEALASHYEQEGTGLDWAEAHRRLAASGKPSKLHHPASAEPNRAFPPPRTAFVRTLSRIGA